MHIKTNDVVTVVTGKDRGQKGKILNIDRAVGKVVVEGVNRVYKHVRRSQKNPQGGRLSMEMPIEISNVKLVCVQCGQGTRTGARFADDGSKERYCKKCGAGLGEIAPARAAHAKLK